MEMVQQAQDHFHVIRSELACWRAILEVPYQEFLLSSREEGITLINYIDRSAVDT